ncbi:MAG: methyltransferase type 11 [Bacteroidetes bacterium 4572_77]|nr:MAG: methyltransferase type 11 [Bacteroidetes bacterium 4572_77]
MQYDPIKRSLGHVFNQSPILRKLFYALLDLLLLRTWHVKKAFKQWAKQAPKEVNILDAGMGFGQYSWFMSRLKPQGTIKGVDVKQEQVTDCNNFFKQAKQKNASFEVADLTQFQEVNKYDFVLSVDVMEHIEEDVAVLKNFYASMKKGGILLVSTPSDQGGSDVHHHEHEHDHENDGSDSFIDEHVRDGYSIPDIKEKLKKAGFVKSEAYYSYGWPGKISWRLSMKYPILMLNTSKIFFIILPFYYLITFPFALILNFLDLQLKHSTGTGLIVKAWK